MDGPYERGLSIISIRNPYDYASAMTDICYECGPQKHNRQNPEVFIGTPWHGGNHADDHRFDNLMAMRRDKYCNYLEKAAKLTDCIMMVHSEDNMLPIHQERFVWRMAMLTGWPLKGKHPSTVVEYSGHKGAGGFKLSKLIDNSLIFKKYYTAKDKSVIRAVDQVIEGDFEKAFGYKSLVLPEERHTEPVAQQRQEDPNAQQRQEDPNAKLKAKRKARQEILRARHEEIKSQREGIKSPDEEKIALPETEMIADPETIQKLIQKLENIR